MALAEPEKAVRPCYDRVRPSYGDFINSARKIRTKTALLLYIYPDFSVKISSVMEHFEFDYPKKKGKARWAYNKMLID